MKNDEDIMKRMIEMLSQSVNKMDAKLDKLHEDIQDVKLDMKGHKSFVAGVSFVFAVAWTGVTFFWDKIFGGKA